jgi:hypothetical protein
MAIQQKSLFGAPDTPLQAVKAPKPMAAPRPPLPSLDLTHGFDNTELAAEAVFWHRLIINQQMRNIQDPKSRRKFVRGVLSEMKIKQGRSTPLILTRDMLLMKNLG